MDDGIKKCGINSGILFSSIKEGNPVIYNSINQGIILCERSRTKTNISVLITHESKSKVAQSCMTLCNPHGQSMEFSRPE